MEVEGGVGYEVHVPVGPALRLPPQGEPVTLWIHTLVREDALVLYGFADRAERELFRVLITLSHVGPKLAVALLGHLGRQGLAEAVAREDRKALQGVPGVGRKTAERLLVELRDRLPAPAQPAPSGAARPPAAAGGMPEPPSGPVAQVQFALEKMGFRPQQARAAALGAAEQLGDAAEVTELLRLALRSLA